MRQGLVVAVALTVVIVTAGCAGFFADGETNGPESPSTTASTGADQPLRDVGFWIGGRLVGVNGSAIVLDTGERRLALNTTHAVFFVSTDGQQEWASVDTWTNKETGVKVCLSAHIHEDNDLHVVKAFYNSTCTPIAG